MSYHTISYHVISYHVISTHMISCHVISCQIISSHIISSQETKTRRRKHQILHTRASTLSIISRNENATPQTHNFPHMCEHSVKDPEPVRSNECAELCNSCKFTRAARGKKKTCCGASCLCLLSTASVTIFSRPRLPCLLSYLYRVRHHLFSAPGCPAY